VHDTLLTSLTITLITIIKPDDQGVTAVRVIQGFISESQHAIGLIRLELTMGDLSTSSIFHVINSKTSYKLLLRCPWLHEHKIVASTLHQCRKYYRGSERKINEKGDSKVVKDTPAAMGHNAAKQQ